MADNPGLGAIPIRRGYWDADNGSGWGMDKAWHYHNIRSLTAQLNVMQSTNRVLQGNGNWQLRAYAYKLECESGGVNCVKVDERQVLGIYNPRAYTEYYDWPAGNPLGLQTMYCNQGGVTACPSWVTLALASIANDSTPLGGTQVAPEPTLPTDLQTDQWEFLELSTTQDLLDRIEAGELVLSASFAPVDE